MSFGRGKATGTEALGVLASLIVSLVCLEARADEAVRVVIAGPKKDALAARLEKELVALGYAPIAVGAIADCAGPAVETAVKDAGASAALCSNGGSVAVWTDDGKDLKLRDTVVARDAHGAETIAMQAAEVMRANIAFREPESVPAPPTKPPPLPMGGWEDLDGEERVRRKPKPSLDRAPLFTLSAGASYLISNGASIGSLSLATSIGIHRYFSLAFHVEAPPGATRATPMSSTPAPDGSRVRLTPGLAGAGIEIPFATPDSFAVPRVGVNVGAAWVRAATTGGTLYDSFENVFTATPELKNTQFAPVVWGSFAVSFKVAGPLRVVAEGMFGATAGSILIVNQNVPFSRWGVPIAAAGLRAEVLIP